jgi:hypothetical protein
LSTSSSSSFTSTLGSRIMMSLPLHSLRRGAWISSSYFTPRFGVV